MEGDQSVSMLVEVCPQFGVICSYRWFLDGIEMNHRDSRFNLDSSANQASLTVCKADSQTQGLIKVLVSNPYGEEVSSAKLTVNSKPKLVASLHARYLLARESELLLKVIATGSPAPEATWFLNDIELSSSKPGLKLETDTAAATYTLTLADVRETDSGQYKCKLSNCFGEQMSFTDVRVVGPPVFTRSLVAEKVLFENDHDVCFDIEYEENPTLTEVKWYLGGFELMPSDKRFKFIKLSPNAHQLTVVTVTEQLAGRLLCRVFNKFGEIDSETKITINSRARVIEIPATDMRVALNRPVTLEVKFTGNPAPQVAWYHNGHEIDSSANESMNIAINMDNKLSTLKIESISEDFNGADLSCRVTNEFGTDASNTKIKVCSKAVFEVELKDKETIAGAVDVELCTVLEESPLDPVVEWFVDDIAISSDDERYLIKSDKINRIYRLLIGRADLGTQGK